jgi:hypothetical protein
MRKVYIVFAYDRYYPAGPDDDIAGVYQTQEAADARVTELHNYTYKWDYVDWHEFIVLDSDEENV